MTDIQEIIIQRRRVRRYQRALLNAALIIAGYQLCSVLSVYFNIFFG